MQFLSLFWGVIEINMRFYELWFDLLASYCLQCCVCSFLKKLELENFDLD